MNRENRPEYPEKIKITKRDAVIIQSPSTYQLDERVY